MSKNDEINACLKSFTHEAAPDIHEADFGMRERLMYARLLFTAGEVGQANLTVQTITPESCLYSTLPAVQMLCKYKTQLTQKATEILYGVINATLPECHLQAQRGKANSFSMMSLHTLLFMGDGSAAEGLERLCAHCLEYDAPDEYISPFYTALQLEALAGIQAFTAEASVASNAYRLENQIWGSLLERCHPALSQLAGPYSRAYSSELCGFPQAVLGALEAVLGENSPFSIKETLWSESYIDKFMAHGTLACTRTQLLFAATTEYHCSAEKLAEWKSRKYPREGKMHTYTPEAYDVSIHKTPKPNAGFDYPAQQIWQKTVLGESYAFGYANGDYENGMATANPFLLYKAGGFTRSFFTKLVKNDKYIGEWNYFEDIDLRLSQCNFPDDGRKTACETKEGIMLHYSPRTFCQNAQTLKLCFILPEHFNKVQQVECGGIAYGEECNSAVISNEPITIRDGGFSMRLVPQDKDGQLTLVRKNNFLHLQWYKPVQRSNMPSWDILLQIL